MAKPRPGPILKPGDTSITVSASASARSRRSAVSLAAALSLAFCGLAGSASSQDSQRPTSHRDLEQQFLRAPWTEAVAQLEARIEAQPNDDSLLELRNRVWAQQGRSDELRGQLEQTGVNRLDEALALARLEGSSAAAESWCQRAEEIAPSATRVALQWADLELARGAPQEALQRLEALQAAQAPDRFWITLARAHKLLEDEQAALAALDSLPTPSPWTGAAELLRAQWAVEQQHWREATRALEAARFQRPADVLVYATLARLQIARKRAEDALTTLETGSRLAPGNAELAMIKADALARLERWEELAQHVESTLDVAPTAAAFEIAAQAYLEQKNEEAFRATLGRWREFSNGSDGLAQDALTYYSGLEHYLDGDLDSLAQVASQLPRGPAREELERFLSILEDQQARLRSRSPFAFRVGVIAGGAAALVGILLWRRRRSAK